MQPALLFSGKSSCCLPVEIVCWSYKRNYITQKVQVRGVSWEMSMLSVTSSDAVAIKHGNYGRRCRLFLCPRYNNLRLI
jgi:hypothetical protein